MEPVGPRQGRQRGRRPAVSRHLHRGGSEVELVEDPDPVGHCQHHGNIRRRRKAVELNRGGGLSVHRGGERGGGRHQGGNGRRRRSGCDAGHVPGVGEGARDGIGSWLGVHADPVCSGEGRPPGAAGDGLVGHRGAGPVDPDGHAGIQHLLDRGIEGQGQRGNAEREAGGGSEELPARGLGQEREGVGPARRERRLGLEGQAVLLGEAQGREGQAIFRDLDAGCSEIQGVGEPDGARRDKAHREGDREWAAVDRQGSRHRGAVDHRRKGVRGVELHGDAGHRDRCRAGGDIGVPVRVGEGAAHRERAGLGEDALHGGAGELLGGAGPAIRSGGCRWRA